MEKEFDKLTKDEKSLLLFLETAATDYGGKLNCVHMNQSDINTANKWTKEGFVTFSRLASVSLPKLGKHTHAVTLSDKAWEFAHQERKARFNRIYFKRDWLTVIEYDNIQTL